MDGVVGKPETGFTCSGEGSWDPGVFVRVIPDSDTDAILDTQACIDRVCVVDTLLGVISGRGWKTAEANIEFGVGDFDSEIRIGFEDVGKIGLSRCVANGEMSLETYTIDLNTAVLERLDEIAGCVCFGTGVLDVVIVIVKLDVRVILSCSLESNGNVVWTDYFVELE